MGLYSTAFVFPSLTASSPSCFSDSDLGPSRFGTEKRRKVKGRTSVTWGWFLEAGVYSYSWLGWKNKADSFPWLTCVVLQSSLRTTVYTYRDSSNKLSSVGHVWSLCPCKFRNAPPVAESSWTGFKEAPEQLSPQGAHIWPTTPAPGTQFIWSALSPVLPQTDHSRPLAWGVRRRGCPRSPPHPPTQDFGKTESYSLADPLAPSPGPSLP